MPGFIWKDPEVWYSGVNWQGKDTEFKEYPGDGSSYSHPFDNDVQCINADMQCGLLSNTHVHGLFRSRDPYGVQAIGRTLTVEGDNISFSIYYKNKYALHDEPPSEREMFSYGEGSSVPLIGVYGGSPHSPPPYTNADGRWVEIEGKAFYVPSLDAVFGTHTKFTRDFVAGSFIYFPIEDTILPINRIDDNTKMVVRPVDPPYPYCTLQKVYRYIPKYYPLDAVRPSSHWSLYKLGTSYLLSFPSGRPAAFSEYTLIATGGVYWSADGNHTVDGIQQLVVVNSYPVWYHSLKGEEWTKYTGELLSGFSQTASNYPPSGDNPDNWPYAAETSAGYKYEGPKMLPTFGQYRPKDLKHLRWLIRGHSGHNKICRGAPIPANFVPLGCNEYTRETANNGKYCYFFNTSRGKSSEDFTNGIIRVAVTNWKYLTLWIHNIVLPFTSNKLDVGSQNIYGGYAENFLITDDGILYFAYADDEHHTIGVLGLDCHYGTVYYHYQEESTQYPLESKIYLYGAYIAFNRGPITPIEDQDWIIIK